jgi:hypothetical protein
MQNRTEQQLTNPKLFQAKWTERDEAVFLDLLQRKIGELKFEMRECESPYVRARLKEKREEYKLIFEKVKAGQYNSNILAAEMAVYQAAKADSNVVNAKGNGKYVDSYDDIDFNFDAYFRKRRYYGVALPLVNLLLVLVFFMVMFFGVFFPPSVSNPMEDAMFGGMIDSQISFSAIGYVRLSDERDIFVANDGNWPARLVWEDPSKAFPYGEPAEISGVAPGEGVWLNRHLGIQAIYIGANDVLAAFFFTPAMSNIGIGFLENLVFDDPNNAFSWYHRAFVASRREPMGMFQRDAAGNLDWWGTLNYLATYGAIYLFIILFFLLAIEIAMSVVRMFTHTARRFRFIPFFILLCALLIFLCPVLATHSSANGSFGDALSTYFGFSWSIFVQGSGFVSVNWMTFGLTAIMLVVLMLPMFFRNKVVKHATSVPKGNRPHTYQGHMFPTRPGEAPQGVLNPSIEGATGGKKKGKKVKGGSAPMVMAPAPVPMPVQRQPARPAYALPNGQMPSHVSAGIIPVAGQNKNPNLAKPIHIPTTTTNQVPKA